MGFGTIPGIRHALGVLELTTTDRRRTTVLLDRSGATFPNSSRKQTKAISSSLNENVANKENSFKMSILRRARNPKIFIR